MEIRHLHNWHVTTAEARQIQGNLAGKVETTNLIGEVRHVAGIDVSAESRNGLVKAAVVVFSYPDLKLTEVRVVESEASFPYIPGYLSFRECPPILKACERLRSEPDLFLVDGQGLAHPRRLGLASHVGLLCDRPTIGCAKSRLCGTHGLVPPEKGSHVPLMDNDQVIGAVVRTRQNVKPLYISVGHKVSLQAAITWVMNCCRKTRLPEPVRAAHVAAKGTLSISNWKT